MTTSNFIAPGGLLMPGAPRPPHHPLAAIFPMLADERRPSFRASLEKNGQRKPIVLHKGSILDGRNRERELVELGRPVAYVIFTGTLRQALDFVADENLERRDLTDKQRAMIAAKIATMRLGDNQYSKPDVAVKLPLAPPADAPSLPPDPAADDRPVAAAAPPIGGPEAHLSHAEAAKLMHVPLRQVEKAAAIERAGAPELKDAVERGPVSLTAGADIATLPLEEQRRIIAAADPKVVKDVSKKLQAEKRAASRDRRLDNMRKPDATPLLHAIRPAGVLYVDVPRKFVQWSSETGADKSPEQHYRVEYFDYLAGLRDDVLKLCKPDCVLYMWAWASSLLDQVDLMAEWGFAAMRRRDESGRLLRGPDGKILPPVGEGRYRTHQIWAKRASTGNYNRGTGYWFIDCHELLLVAARGDVPAPFPGTQDFSITDATVGEHSAKPDAFRAQIDRYFSGVPKTELFARPLDRARWPDWEFWGNEFADAPTAQGDLKMEAAE